MRPLLRSERLAVWLWLIVAVVVWNGLYDILLTRAAKEHLLRWALHEAGRGPQIPLAHQMAVSVRDAIWVATLWSAAILLAGMMTVRLMNAERRMPNAER
jgi:hypothetical protein